MEEQLKEELQKKKQKYSIEYKLGILDLLNKGISYHIIENKMNLDRAMVRRWKDNEEQLRLIKIIDKKYRKKQDWKYKKNYDRKSRKNICNFIKECREKKKAFGTII